MAAELTNYQCPACMGPLRYSGSEGMLVCDYCDSTFPVAEIEELYRQKEETAAQEAQQEPTQWELEAQQWQDADVVAFDCPSCGAQLVAEQTTAATACPYCGNPSIVPGRLHGTLKPDYVIPFVLDKKAATEALRKHTGGKYLLPKVFRDENHLQEIKGIYVPFWLYDGVADGDVHFHGTRVHTHRRGDYEITETQHYQIHRAGFVGFSRIPADGSTKMPDDYMDSLEPFDYAQLKPFSTAYLPGFLADKYDVTAAENSPRIEKRCRQSLRALLEADVMGYTTVTPVGENLRVTKGQVSYALLPVWLLYTQWRDKKYLFAVNGQTGKIVGDLPVDKAKMWLTFAGITVGLTALLTAFGAAVPLGHFLFRLFF